MNLGKNILPLIKASVVEVLPDASIILFGSRARNDFKDDSDWDILVLTNEKPEYILNRKLRSKLFQLELDNNICIGSILMNKKEWDKKKAFPIHIEIDRDGVIV